MAMGELMKEVTQNKDGHWEFGASADDRFFKEEDFNFKNDGQNANAAYYANQKIEKYLDSCPVVYGNPTAQYWQSFKGQASHTAKIICIEEIVKEPCKHEPSDFIVQNKTEMPENFVISYESFVFCKHCKTKLKAEWKAIDGK